MTRNCSVLLILLVTACGGEPRDRIPQLELPKALREISGLALLGPDQLLALSDERARVFLIDMVNATVDVYAEFGEPVEKGDYEGIAVLADDLFIVASDGVLLQRTLQPGGAAQSFRRHDTGLAEVCEVEGLAEWPARQLLFVLCKEPYAKHQRDSLLVFAFSPASGRLLEQPVLEMPYAALGIKRLHPSGLTFDENSESLIIVAAREQRIIEITLQGGLISSNKLPNRKTHRQTEGIVLGPAHELYLADEGGKDKGTLTRYPGRL